MLAMLLVNATLWPARARLAMWTPLGRALRSLAELARLAPATREYRAQLQHAVRCRSAVYTELAATLRLSAESTLEPDAGEAQGEREWVGRLTVQAQAAFLAVLALIRHRVAPDFPVLPAPVQEAMRALDTAVGETLDALADRLERRPTSLTLDLAQRLDALEALTSSQNERGSAHDASIVVRGAERDHVAIARTLVHEVSVLQEGIDFALAVRTRD